MDLYKQIQVADRRAARARAYAERAAAFDAQASSTGEIEIYNADARTLSEFVAPDSVDLVFTSPPYNQNIEYHTHDDAMELDAYLDMVREVLAQCFGVLKPGARIGMVVPAGVRRDPYIPFAPLMQTLLGVVGFTHLGEVVWDKGQSVLAGRTAWGSFRNASAPRFRDRTERIVWAYKDQPSLEIPETFLFHDEKGTYTPFLEDSTKYALLATDMWCVNAESATRVGHPAPFPVELAEKAISLFGYPTAVVLDPFGGSGTTMVAAKKQGLRGIMFDIDAGYCELARERVEQVD